MISMHVSNDLKNPKSKMEYKAKAYSSDQPKGHGGGQTCTSERRQRGLCTDALKVYTSRAYFLQD